MAKAKFRGVRRAATITGVTVDRINAKVPADVVAYPEPPQIRWSLASYPYEDPALTEEAGDD